MINMTDGYPKHEKTRRYPRNTYIAVFTDVFMTQRFLHRTTKELEMNDGDWNLFADI